MSKKFNLDNLVVPTAIPEPATAPTVAVTAPVAPVAQAYPDDRMGLPMRKTRTTGGARLSVSIDAETYKEMRMAAVRFDLSHQALAEHAIKSFLASLKDQA